MGQWYITVKKNKMKRLYVFLITIMTICVSGCQQKSQNEPTNSSDPTLVGEWKLTSVKLMEKDGSQYISKEYEFEDGYIKFEANNTFTSLLTNQDVATGKWNIVSKVLILNYDEWDTIQYEILEFTANTLVLKQVLAENAWYKYSFMKTK